MSSKPEVKVHIAADTAALRADLAKMSSEIGKHAAAAQGSLSGVDKALGAIKGGFAALTGVVGVGGLVSIARGALDAAGGIGELADQIGIGTTALQELEYGAATAGVKTDDLHGALTKLTAKIGEAADGSDTAIASFDAMGVKILDSAGKTRSTEAVLKDIAQAYAETGDKAVAAARMKDIFGKSAQKLIPLIKDGAAGLDLMAANAAHVKAVLADGMIASADEASDKIAAMEKAAAKASQTFMAKLAPAITAVLDAWRKGTGGSTLEEDITDQVDKVIEAEKKLDEYRNLSFWNPGRTNAIRDQKRVVERERAELARMYAVFESRLETKFAAGSAPGVANPEGKGATAKAADDVSRYAETLDKATRALDEQAASLGRTGAQVAVYSALFQAGVDTSALVVDAAGRVTEGLSAQEMALAEAARRSYDLKSAEEARIAAQTRLNQSEADAWDKALKTTEARDKIITSMDQEIESARQLLASLSGGEEAYARTKLVMDAVNEARRAGIELSQAEMEKIKANAATITDLNARTQQHRNTVAELGAFGDQAFSRIGSAMTTMAMEGNDAFASLRNIGMAVVSELYQEFAKLAVVNPVKTLMGLGGGSLPTLGGMLGSINFSDIWYGNSGTQVYSSAASVGPFLSELPGFASGTPNAPPGWAVVGEKGPELMKIPGGAQIFPADISARLASGDWPGITPPAIPSMTTSAAVAGHQVTNNHFVIDARGADREGLARLEQRIAYMDGTIERRAINAVTDASQRGGAAARAIRGR